MSKEKVLEVLKESGQAMKVGEIVAASGLDKKDVEKSMNKLKKEELIVSPKRCFWEAK